MTRWLLTRLASKEGIGTTPFGCQGCHHKLEGASNGVGAKGDLKPKNGFGGFGGLAYKLK